MAFLGIVLTVSPHMVSICLRENWRLVGYEDISIDYEIAVDKGFDRGFIGVLALNKYLAILLP